MRFMVMHKVDASMEAGAPPNQQIVQGMGALVQESLKNGTFITGAGLHRSQKRVRVQSASGKVTKQVGPYSGDNELLASYAMIKVKTMDEAVAHAARYAEALGDANVEVGPVVQPWDIGVMDKPAGEIPVQALLLTKADAEFERGEASFVTKRDHALAVLGDSLGSQGAMLATGTLAPSARSVRLSAPVAGKRTWIDGPFTESKELIAGFSVLEVPTLEAAKAWAERYAAVLGDNEVDVRPLVD